MAKPGTTVYVAEGTYEGSIGTAASGTADARIAYVSTVKWGAKVIGDGENDSAWHNTGDYVDIVGFDITGAGTDGLTEAGSFGRIVDNRVYGFSGNCIYTANADYSMRDIDVIGNVAYGCGRSSLDHGICVSHPNGSVSNNIVYGNSGYGIHCWHNCNRLAVANNVIFNNGEGGILIGQGDSPNDGKVAANDFIVANNIAVRNGDHGGIAESGTTGPNNKYLNNNVYDNAPPGLDLKTGTESSTITTSPLFLDFKDDGSGDYRLQSTSPNLDAGTTAGVPPVDIAGRMRPQGSGVDIGGYED